MKVLFTKNLKSLSEMADFVEELEGYLSSRTILLLVGEVGAGKTETVRFLARRRGYKEVASPSFAIHLRYEDSKGERPGLDHLDLYRVTSEEDLESTGFWDLLSEPEGLIVIEWADRIDASFLPRNWNLIRVTYEKGPGLEDRSLKVEQLP